MRRYLTYANVISTLCLVLVVGGGAAYAANTIDSSDVIDDTLQSVDIKNNQLRSTDVLDASLTGADIANDSIAGADVTDNSIRGADVASNALDGLDIVEGSLVLDDHFSAVAAPAGSCFDDQHTGTICAQATINLERPGRILMNASGQWRTTALNDTNPPGDNTDHSTAVAGSCVMRVDGSSDLRARR